MEIRNFSIIAHIDHGKSTLADRLLEITRTVEKRKMRDQFLDNLELERERGITIKLQTVRMKWRNCGKDYILNLIDTPGHVDFSYEVSRALAAGEGAILLVDATQGIQAQTISHALKALDLGLVLIPTVNKIDLPNAQPEKTAKDICKSFGFHEEEVVYVSAKTGQNIKKLLCAIVERIPPPRGDPNHRLQALVFDSFYDSHKGAIALVKVQNGQLNTKEKTLLFIGSTKTFTPMEYGYLSPTMLPTNKILTGEVGYIATGCKTTRDIRVGDTITYSDRKATPLPGYKPPTPMVFASLFPLNTEELDHFRDSFEKLTLNDAAVQFSPIHHPSLGVGYRCGFLGLLHLEIVKERLEKEFKISVLIASPSVPYKVKLKDQTIITISEAEALPPIERIAEIQEPWVRAEVITPQSCLGPIMQLITEKRGIIDGVHFASTSTVIVKTDMPLGELITDTFDKIKAISHGYASLDYQLSGYRQSDIVKLDILVNKELIPPLSTFVHKTKSYSVGKKVVEKLKSVIPRHQFSIPIQASIGGKIIARETVPAFRKDVLAGMYGGDVRRKIKKLEKQKKGKKKLRKFGKVSLPAEAFLAVLSQQ